MSVPVRRIAVVVAALTMLIAACGGTDTATTESTAAPTTMPMAENDHDDFVFGEPADPLTADRVIEVVASDDFRFEPAEITVAVGETVTFRITNAGAIPHDFTLGDEAAQAAHAEEMAEMSGMTMPDEPNAIVIAPGETKELTWHFTQAGDLIIGCHEIGHYEAGMRAAVVVEG